MVSQVVKKSHLRAKKSENLSVASATDDLPKTELQCTCSSSIDCDKGIKRSEEARLTWKILASLISFSTGYSELNPFPPKTCKQQKGKRADSTKPTPQLNNPTNGNETLNMTSNTLRKLHKGLTFCDECKTRSSRHRRNCFSNIKHRLSSESRMMGLLTL